ncbi:mesoderm induction early response protein 1-like isoform X1 [Hydractinia symbiolongicarpus]|uniref:mesoderm induction early response protein 1-like isoform X1 n=1 Tax=Hydractinia symbiolongicarpus TaxID=13093 RepID=UPI00254AE0A3|nr:mesoderm induction early response protein 1-like isoform X1 [Hydractinia symbiolongicarpus]
MSTNTEKANTPSPSYSSDSNDHDFAVTAEMMVDGEDYENTLDEEEEMDDEDGEDELADLQKEGEMPIEELLAMYYGNSTEASEVAPQENVTDNSPKSEGINTTSNPLNNETQDENKDNEIDPFFNQRITRGLAALNSQYFEEDFSSDEDYQPTPEDWKKEIQLGKEYQAVVQDTTAPYEPNEKTCDMDDKLLWRPGIVSKNQLQQYLNIVYKLTDANTQTADHDDEQALYTLLQMKDVEKALGRRQEQERQPPDVSLWSEEECQNFEQGLRVFGKDFRLIQKNKVQTRTVGEIVQFYYLWKKTERHDAFVTQTKLGRKKYTLPGIADMMGRFMEETEGMFSSRSGSPNIEQQTTVNYANISLNQSEPAVTCNGIKEENNFDNYENHNGTYYGNYANATAKPAPNTNNTSNADSWRTSPNPISVGSVN